MSVFLALTSLASAGDVLWYVGNSSPISSGGHSGFDTSMSTAGSTGVDSSSSWPASFSGYKVVVLAVSSTNFSTTETSDLSTFLGGGGILVLMGESTGYNSAHVSVFNTLASSLGLTNTFSSSANYDSSCGWAATVSKKGHSLTDGITSLSYAYSGDVVVGSGGVELLQGASGQALIAYEDQVVFAADSNIFDDSCTQLAGNDTFFQNLYSGVCEDPKTDEDGDGYIASSCGGDDCDDSDATINPDTLWYYDGDGDGYGDATLSLAQCSAPEGYVDNSNDCNDDDESTVLLNWYIDSDGDGYGEASEEVFACEQPSGYVADATDCDDSSSLANPGLSEVCDGLDNDCNNAIDDNAADAPAWYFDSDEDGYGSDVDVLYSCDQPSAYVADGGDCDDERFNISPASVEYCNVFDDNCNGLIDEDAVDMSAWYPDLDGDGYGDTNGMVLACDQPASFVSNGIDCDDTDAAEWTVVEGFSYTCGASDADEVLDETKGCSAVSGVTGGLLLSLVGLIGRRREEA